MHEYDGELLHSATDLNTFLACPHAVALNLRKLRDPASLPDRVEDDETNVLVQKAGHAHEAAYLAQLRAETSVAEVPSTSPLADRVAATLTAMRSGVPVIAQAAFRMSPWHGYADFLRRVERPSALGTFSYEPVDTKLARNPDPKHVLQISLYSELISGIQQTMPREMHLVLGDGRQESFRTAEFRYTLGAAKARYLDFVTDGAPLSSPEPCSHCSFCGWREYCSAQWEREDHLSRTAGINRSQIKKLRDAGIKTVAELAALPETADVPKLAPQTLRRLRAQAALQVARRTGQPTVELLPAETGRGFARMPRPDPHDLFFDLEGDPLYPDGLEYLWGVHYRDGRGTARFRHCWAHDRDAERAAFESTVDFFVAHLEAHPGAHIYHYAPYELAVLRRLSTAFASREGAVDWLLRNEKLVDLYAVVRQALRTSEPDLSLKTLEVFFAPVRGEEVRKADQSIVHYHRWRESGDGTLLDGLLAYNRVDCQNTEGLRDWLAGLRSELPWWTKEGAGPEPGKAAEILQQEAARESLRRLIRTGATHLSERGRELMVHLLDFHIRAKKPEQWAVFDRCSREAEELIEDGECIGHISPSGKNWQRPDKRSTVATYRFPGQDTKLREGSRVLHAPTRESLGTIVRLDRGHHIVEVRRGNKPGATWPETGSIIPGWPLDTDPLEQAVADVATAWAEGGADRYRALGDLIERRAPRLAGWPGGELVAPGESLIEAATARALALDESTLFIQGPPGTGKTHTSAHMIVSLIDAGKRVGVSSNSHKAINNLLAKVEETAAQRGVTFRGVKKASAGDSDSRFEGQLIRSVTSNDDVSAGDRLVAGTAWLFACFDEDFDYLFVDEAGQVSLGHLVAMGKAAKNIILVGDQMQLGQPIQGAHPGESGLSALDYLLQGAATIAPDRGILLDVSWRMNPAIQEFISDAVYDGRLLAHPDCARQLLVLGADADPDLRACGIRILAMDHEGCSQHSDQEVEKVAALYARLMGQRFVDREGNTATIGHENVLVVAPYNMQVNALKARLPADARIGTVDKFQGQEAEVVIVSLATSSPDDLPRHVDFFYSKNRLNVAISRARTLAIVLASPRLLELDARTVEHLRLVNTLAWLTDLAGRPE